MRSIGLAGHCRANGWPQEDTGPPSKYNFIAVVVSGAAQHWSISRSRTRGKWIFSADNRPATAVALSSIKTGLFWPTHTSSTSRTPPSAPSCRDACFPGLLKMSILPLTRPRSGYRLLIFRSCSWVPRRCWGMAGGWLRWDHRYRWVTLYRPVWWVRRSDPRRSWAYEVGTSIKFKLMPPSHLVTPAGR